MNPVSIFLADNGFWGLVAVLGLNLFQRKQGKKARKKRQATLFIAIAVFGLYAFAILVVQLKLHDLFLLVYVAAAAVVFYLLREHILPFRLKCVSCGQGLEAKEIFFDDSNICEKCHQKDKSADLEVTSADDDSEEDS